MKTNDGKISMIALGLLTAGVFCIATFGFWDLDTTGLFTHGLVQGYRMMSYGTNFWGIILAVGVVMLMGIGSVTMLKSGTEQNNRTTPSCLQCGTELADGDREFCSACGEPIDVK